MQCLLTQTETHARSPPTLLSELGIIASVIQEPKRDPEARTVIGLLTAVKRPQPVDKVFVFNSQKPLKERLSSSPLFFFTNY